MVLVRASRSYRATSEAARRRAICYLSWSRICRAFWWITPFNARPDGRLLHIMASTVRGCSGILRSRYRPARLRLTDWPCLGSAAEAARATGETIRPAIMGFAVGSRRCDDLSASFPIINGMTFNRGAGRRRRAKSFRVIFSPVITVCAKGGLAESRRILQTRFLPFYLLLSFVSEKDTYDIFVNHLVITLKFFISRKIRFLLRIVIHSDLIFEKILLFVISSNFVIKHVLNIRCAI